MTQQSWKHSLLALKPMMVDAATTYPTLRLVVFDGIKDPIRAQQALGEVESVELHGCHIGYTLWSQSRDHGRVMWGHLAFREKDVDGAPEFHHLADMAGACLRGHTVTIG